MTTQPEALRLADRLEKVRLFGVEEECWEAADELRRQHDEVEKLQAERDAAVMKLIAVGHALQGDFGETHPRFRSLELEDAIRLRTERDALKAAAEKGTEYVLAQINQDLRAERDALLADAKRYRRMRDTDHDEITALKAERDALLAEVERLKRVNYDMAGQLTVLRATKQMQAAIDAAKGEK